MKLEHYKFNSECMGYFSGNILSPMRRGLIKFHHRIHKVAKRFNLSVDEVYTIWAYCMPGLGNRYFWRYFVTDEYFRNTMIRRILENEDI